MMFEDINTLKYFIKNANKEKLAEITQNNPTYFYDILPYAYALGLSIRWIEKFKDTTLNVPKWYFDNYFDIKVLKSFIFETIPYIVKNDKENIQKKDIDCIICTYKVKKIGKESLNLQGILTF